jgi:hypothetical protein
VRKSKEILTTEKENSFSRIMRFLTDGDISLKPQEETILARLNHSYKLQLQRKFTERQVCEKIQTIYQVSYWTAQSDYYQAQALFGGAIKTNKKFVLHHHAESIMVFIEQCKIDKSLVALVPKLMDSYTKAILAIPDEINKDKLPPPVMLFAVIDGQSIPVPKTFDQAMASIKARGQKNYIEFEEKGNE